MKNIEQWLKVLDKNKQPFKKHIISEQLNEHEKQLYAVLHAGFVLFAGNLNQEQETLYKFWLAAISAELKLAQIMQSAQDIASEFLEEGITLLKEKNLNTHFMLDVLIFAFLNNVEDDFKKIINEWCNVFAIEQEELNSILSLVENILQENSEIEYNDTLSILLQNSVWQEFYASSIDFDDNVDIDGGVWFVDKTVKNINVPCKIENAILVFSDQASLSFCDTELEINHSSVINPLIKLLNVKTTFSVVDFIGEYEETNESNTIELGETTKDVVITDCEFKTIDARSLLIKASKATLKGCSFKQCGNKKRNGGAVWHNGNVFFEDCIFENCIAQVAGAIFSWKDIGENHIVNCQFYNCNSIKKWNEQYNAGAIYYNSSPDNTNCIVDSTIDNNMTLYRLNSDPRTSYPKALLANTLIKGMVNYQTSSYGGVLTPESCNLNKVAERTSKNQNVTIDTNTF